MVTRHQRTTVSEAQRPLYIGVDVGGTNIKIGLVDDRGWTAASTSIPTEQERGPQDAVDRMAAAIDRLLQENRLTADDVAAVGLGTPGTMDIPAGMILEPPNLPAWRHFPIRDKLAEAVGRPVAFGNDASVAAFGEYWVGTGADYPSMVLFTLGTGIGCGIIVGGLSIDGENSHGSECGHIIIDYRDSARVCGCGQKGHLEAYASATAVVKRTREALDAGRNSSLGEALARGEELTALLVAQHAERGDALALEIVDETAFYIGIGAVCLMHTIDPGIVVLAGAMNFGGEASELGRRFLERIRQVVRERAFRVIAERTPVEFASLGGDAGYLGAAGIARQLHQGQEACG